MIQALLGEAAEDRYVVCRLCAHECRIAEGKTGICRVRKNVGGELFSLNSDRVVAQHVDPIEKKPLYHFLPGSRSFSVAAMGCNFSCRFCQNHAISMVADETTIHGDAVAPERLVALAKQCNARSIAYTYTEPTVFFELVMETAQRAREAGIRNVLVSNGYMTARALALLGPFLDGANIDLKAFNDGFYRKYCSARLQPVLETIAAVKAMGIWLEVTTLLIPGLNDEPRQITELVGFLRGLDRDIPWHVSRFFPQYRMEDIPPTDAESIDRFLHLAEDGGLHFPYAGNLPDSRWSQTLCPQCRKLLIARSGYHAEIVGLHGGACRCCGAAVAGVWS